MIWGMEKKNFYFLRLHPFSFFKKYFFVNIREKERGEIPTKTQKEMQTIEKWHPGVKKI
jgi:hypothetical protein